MGSTGKQQTCSCDQHHSHQTQMSQTPSTPPVCVYKNVSSFRVTPVAFNRTWLFDILIPSTSWETVTKGEVMRQER